MQDLNVKSSKRFVWMMLLGMLLIITACRPQTLPYDAKMIEDRSIHFVHNQLSDGGNGTPDRDLGIAANADALQQLLAMKREAVQTGSIPDAPRKHFLVDDIAIVEAGTELEVAITTTETYDCPYDPVFEHQTNHYRLRLVQEDTEWRVEKAISTDPSGRLILPQTVVGKPASFTAYDFMDYDEMIAQAYTRQTEVPAQQGG